MVPGGAIGRDERVRTASELTDRERKHRQLDLKPIPAGGETSTEDLRTALPHYRPVEGGHAVTVAVTEARAARGGDGMTEAKQTC